MYTFMTVLHVKFVYFARIFDDSVAEDQGRTRYTVLYSTCFSVGIGDLHVSLTEEASWIPSDTRRSSRASAAVISP